MTNHKSGCNCKQCIAILNDHERRIAKLEAKKKSKRPKWFEEWNDDVFIPLLHEIKEIKIGVSNLDERVSNIENQMVRKDELDEILDKKLRQHLKPSAFKDSK